MRLKPRDDLQKKSFLGLSSVSVTNGPFILLMGERRGLNPRVVDSQSTALIHLATSAPII